MKPNVLGVRNYRTSAAISNGGSTNPYAQVINILRSYGTDAHVYLPGIGVINGLTAGNYLESTGNTSATVDNPVGLILDAAGSVGAENIINGDFSNGTNNWNSSGATLSVVDGKLRVTNTGATPGQAVQQFSTVIGKTYRVNFNLIDGTATALIRINAGTSVDYTATSNTAIYVTGGVTFIVRLFANNGIVGAYSDFDNISVKEVTGIHVSQATTANKPILRSTGGNYSWQFDGTNDHLDLGSIPFQMTDDHCVIAGVRNDSAAATSKVAFSEYGAAAVRVAQLSFETTTLTATWTDDAGTAGTSPTGSAVTAGTTVVATARKVGNAKELRKNGVSINTSNVAAGATTLTNATIGANATAFFNGGIHPEIIIKGTVTDANCLILERFVGQLSGVPI